MSTYENREIFARFVREVLEQGNLGVIDELVAKDAVSHSMPSRAPGREGLKEGFRQLNAAFTDRRYTVRQVIAEADKVVGHFTVSAVHHGYFMGLPATGERVEYSCMSIVRFEDHKIVEHWSVNNITEAMHALSKAEADKPRPSLLALAQKDVVTKFFAEYAIERVELETIDPMHALAKVHWDSNYIKQDGEREHIELDVTYLLHFEGAKPKIFAYITGDEQTVMREHCWS